MEESNSLARCPDCGEVFEVRLYDTSQVADLLGLAPVTARYRARSNGIGTKVGRDWVFTDYDVERLRELPGPGRPPEKEKPDDAPRDSG